LPALKRDNYRAPVDFAFILHPLKAEDLFKKMRFMQRWPFGLVDTVSRMLPPIFASRIDGVKSAHGSVEGCFIGLALTPEQFQKLPPEVVLRKIISAGKKATRTGAKIIGLGALTAVVGDAGITVARSLETAVTTGNSYTVATALEGTEKAARLMGIDPRRAEVAVLGASGSIGGACTRILARKANFLTLIARNRAPLERVADAIFDETGLAVKVTANVKEAVRKADIIVAVSSTAESLIDPEDLKPGAVVCDVARPRDVSLRVARERDDVLVIEGGVVEVPGDVNFNLDFGFPPKVAYACMAETMILALEKRYESYSLGRELTVAQIDEIKALAARHGFKLAGLRSFGKALSAEDINKIKDRAFKKQKEIGLKPVNNLN